MFRFPFTVLFGQVDAVGITFFSRAFTAEEVSRRVPR